jgi:hypothetical protein
MALLPRQPRQRRESLASREELATLDGLERKVVWGFVGFGALISLYIMYFITKGQQTLTYEHAPVNGKCPPVKGYEHSSLVNGVCHYTHITPASTLWFEFAIIAVATLVLAMFAWRRRRTGAVFVAFILGIALISTAIGLPFVALGGWLMWRAWRLQKYGSASFAGAGGGARAKAAAKKNPSEPKASTSAPAPKKVAEPSKRYTPKKQTKKR